MKPTRCAIVAAILSTGLLAVRATAQPARAAKIRADAASILHSRDFRWEAPHESPLAVLGKAIARSLSDLLHWFSKLFPKRSPFHGFENVDLAPYQSVVVVLFAVMLALVLVMIVFLVRLGLANRLTRKARNPKTKKTVALVARAEEEDTGNLVDSARQAFDRGDMRLACRCLYMALLFRLDAAGVLRYNTACTNGEYLRQVRRDARAYGLLAPQVRRFDLIWYGGRSASVDDYRECLVALDQSRSFADEAVKEAPRRAR